MVNDSAAPGAAIAGVPPLPASGAPQESGPDAWVGFVIVLVALAVACGVARRRTRMAEAEPPGRLMRICYSSMAFSGAMITLLVASEVFRTQPSSLMIPMVGIALASFTLVGMILFGIADFWLGLLRPCRNRSWMVAAIVSFGLVIAAALTLAYWIAGATQELLHPDVLQICGAGIAAGIIWWSFLPAPRRDVSGLFE